MMKHNVHFAMKNLFFSVDMEIHLAKHWHEIAKLDEIPGGDVDCKINVILEQLRLGNTIPC